MLTEGAKKKGEEKSFRSLAVTQQRRKSSESIFLHAEALIFEIKFSVPGASRSGCYYGSVCYIHIILPRRTFAFVLCLCCCWRTTCDVMPEFPQEEKMFETQTRGF